MLVGRAVGMEACVFGPPPIVGIDSLLCPGWTGTDLQSVGARNKEIGRGACFKSKCLPATRSVYTAYIVTSLSVSVGMNL